MTAKLKSYGHALGRGLGLERHEYVAVAWSFAYFFCVLASYYMIRSIRESMGVESGVGTIPYLFTATFVVMLLASPIFAAIASRYRRRQFLPWVYYFFAANILIFWGLFSWAASVDSDVAENGTEIVAMVDVQADAGTNVEAEEEDDSATASVWIGRAFFVWLSVFNLFVVSVFWSFMADIYSRAQGRRLFGVISAGGSLGALFGPLFTETFVVAIGTRNVLPISAMLLLVAVVCIYRLRAWVAADREHEHPDAAERGKPLGGHALAGITRVVRSPYLLMICAKSLLASLLGTALYMFIAQFVSNTIEGTDQRTQFFARIDFWTNLFSLLFQLLIVRHAVKKLGIGKTLSIMPVLSLIGFAVLSMNPLLVFAAVFQGARRAVGFGFAKPTTDMLYSVVTREEKYKSKNFIETVVYRTGDVIGTWSINGILFMGIATVSVVMVPFAALWTVIALWLGREYRRRDASGQFQTVSDSEK